MKQGEKFSKETQNAKRNIRQARLKAGHSVNAAAKALGLSRKQMEDVEAVRNYGCYLSLDLLVRVSKVYSISIDGLIREPKKSELSRAL